MALLQGQIQAAFPLSDRPRRALLLGVTPEIALCPALADWQLTAVDVAENMLRAVWPGNSAQRQALRGHWLHLPIATSSQDLVLGDGVFTLVPYGQGFHDLAASAHRVLRPQGRFLLRAFCRERQESVGQVVDAVRAGQVGNIHVLKWRLAMALQGENAARGVVLDHIWQTLLECFPDTDALFAQTGWNPATLVTVGVYAGNPASYAFPTTAELLDHLALFFTCLERRTLDYELAECCPSLVLAPRG